MPAEIFGTRTTPKSPTGLACGADLEFGLFFYRAVKRERESKNRADHKTRRGLFYLL
jgi:hypothetical protein